MYVQTNNTPLKYPSNSVPFCYILHPSILSPLDRYVISPSLLIFRWCSQFVNSFEKFLIETFTCLRVYLRNIPGINRNSITQIKWRNSRQSRNATLWTWQGHDVRMNRNCNFLNDTPKQCPRNNVNNKN